MGEQGEFPRVIQVTLDDLDDVGAGKSRSIVTLVERLRGVGVSVSVVSPPRHVRRWLVRAGCFVLARFYRPLGKVLRQYFYAAPFIRPALVREIADAEAAGAPYVIHARDARSLLEARALMHDDTAGRSVLTLHHLGSMADEMLAEGYVRPGTRLEAAIRADDARALALADVVTVPGSRARDELLRAFPSLTPAAVRVVANPVAVTRSSSPVTRADLGLAADAFIAFTAIRMKRVKRPDLLLEVAARTVALVPGFRLVIAGDGYRLGAVRQLAQRLGLGRVVSFLGERADVPDLIALADVVVLASERESFGRILAEGAAGGRPLVAFDVGGVNESVVDGVTGFAVPFPDVDAFAARLGALAADAALRVSLGEHARAHAKRFTPERVAGEYLSLYAELCGGAHDAMPAAV